MRLIDADALAHKIAINGDADFINKVTKLMIEVPSIDIEPKRGEWKRRIVDNGFNADWVFSECGYRVKTDFVDYNFCPNCGADMRGEKDE